MNKMMLKKQYMMYSPKKGSSRLPSDFQEVEYIESTGTQYIDSGLSINNPLSFKTEFKWRKTSTSTSDQCLAGARYVTNYSIGYKGPNCYNHGLELAPEFSSIISFTDNTDYDSVFEGGNSVTKYTQNGTTYTSSNPYNQFNTYGYNITLFAMNQGGSVRWFFVGRLYHYSFTINGTKVRDFIPCYRKSDNEIGLYDLVGKQFYTNQGSGSFLKGKDVIYTSTNAVSFATDSWSTIQAEAERISNFYEKYGFIPFNTPYGIYYPENNDTNNIRTIIYNNEEIQIAIIGMCHDTLQTSYSGGGTKAGITWQTTKSLFKSAVDSSSASGGWSSCSLRTSLNSTHFNLLPQEMQNAIKVVAKKSNNGSGSITTSNDKLFTLSMVEIMGTNKRNNSTTLAIEGEGTQYEYYKNAPLIIDSKNITRTGLSGTKGTCIANGNSYMTIIGGVQTPDANDYVNYRNAKEYKPSGSASYYSTRSFRETFNECMYVWRTGIVSYSPATNKDLEVCFAGCI